jgi:hypothetical protein
MNYPNLARFIADHFGGYPDAKTKADEECGGDIDAMLAEFTGFLIAGWMNPPIDPSNLPEALEQADKFLATCPNFDQMREIWFTDSGNPKLSMEELGQRDDDTLPYPPRGFRILCEIVWFNN